jgi:hypothetical protein
MKKGRECVLRMIGRGKLNFIFGSFVVPPCLTAGMLLNMLEIPEFTLFGIFGGRGKTFVEGEEVYPFITDRGKNELIVARVPQSRNFSRYWGDEPQAPGIEVQV